MKRYLYKMRSRKNSRRVGEKHIERSDDGRLVRGIRLYSRVVIVVRFVRRIAMLRATLSVVRPVRRIAMLSSV